MKGVTRNQKRIPGLIRDQLPSCILPEVRAAIEKHAARHAVSRSFWIAVALADAVGLSEIQEQYLQSETRFWRHPVSLTQIAADRKRRAG
jgi:hypothetical protein